MAQKYLGIQTLQSEEFQVNFCNNLRNFWNLRNSSDCSVLFLQFSKNPTLWGICLGKIQNSFSKPNNSYKNPANWGIFFQKPNRLLFHPTNWGIWNRETYIPHNVGIKGKASNILQTEDSLIEFSTCSHRISRGMLPLQNGTKKKGHIFHFSAV